MNSQDSAPDWTNQAWLEEAQIWIAAALSEHSRTLSGPITQPHLRPWSTVLHVPTNAGDYYFKAAAPVLAHEIALTAALADWLPHHTLTPIAVDHERAWMLLPDGGPRLREQFRADRDLAYWSRVLPVYTASQIALATRIPELLALGTPDRRLASLAALYEQLLVDVQGLAIDQDVSLTTEERRKLAVFAPQIAEWCTELAALPVPESLHHGDLHDGNVFLRDTGPVFFDWGDASVAHPFVSMRTVFVSVEIALDLPDGGAANMPFVDAYLEPWQRFAPAGELRRAFVLAQRLAPLVSALSWHRAVANLPAAQQREYAPAVAHLLRELMQNEEVSVDHRP